ncbi:unnamed protein product [Allacma fusca]|uniref:CRAL-TRIO domain-containing protein n=1 Tax=Allacma fusca TaxID=39272 RepID=A0A8J2KDC0_9HEXA|nr:unnamed protein product [Allacma fusca]
MFLMSVVSGQIPVEEIPSELKLVLDPELEIWESPEELLRECPYYLSGFDEENRPIWILEFGVWPTKDILARGREWEDAYKKYVNKMYQNIFNSVTLRATTENPVKEVNLIMDLDKYTIRHFSSIKAASFATKTLQLLAAGAKLGHVVCIVNANSFSQVVLNFVRPVLGSALERVEIFGSNKNSWIPKLLKLLPKDQLSEKYGGRKDFKPVQVYG